MNDSSKSFLPSIVKYTDVDETQIQGLMNSCTPDQMRIIGSAIDAAYKKGQDDSDARTAKLMARVFSAFIGVTAGIDQSGHDGASDESRVRRMINLMMGAR